MKAWPFLVAIASVSCVIAVAACSETGPDAPPRSNGCIDLGCPVDEAGVPVVPDGGGTGTADGATFPNPLEGTTKQATLIKGKFRFTEGPVWIGGRLLFTDVPAGNIVELLADNTTTTNFRTNSGNANGLAVDSKGNLFACEGGAKRVTKSNGNKGAAANPIAETFNDNQFNAPNDVIVRADGNVYFTDPNYSGDPNTQDAEAVYRIDPQGNVSRVEQQFSKPNGIALSPDGNTLYVVDNGAGKLLSGPVDAGGGVGGFTEMATVTGGDGMAVDDAGNLYVTDEAGVDVFDRTGKSLGTIAVAVKPTNCTFGGADRRTLYITANAAELNAQTGLYSIKLNVPGLP
jgi:gluconolactonase